VMEYGRKHKLEVDLSAAGEQYTRDANIWGVRCSGGDLADITRPPNPAAFVLTRTLSETPDKPLDVTIRFEKGEPVAVDGEELESIELLEKLNAVGGEHGVGRVDVIENRLMGFKNREVYEAPGATILHSAHGALERLVLEKSAIEVKQYLSNKYAETVYGGLWFSTLREALDAFMSETQEFVTGDVTVRLFKGSVSAIIGHSEYSTYDRELANLGPDSTKLPPGAAEGMLAIARLLQINRAFKQKPRT